MADPSLPRSAAGDRNPWLIAVIVSIATFMEVLDTTIANVSLRHIAGSLAASADESTYILTSYLVSNAVVLPISGWLANVIGRKRFYMGSVALFTISSLFCALSTSLTMMICFRVLQGIGGGGLAPVEQSIFADTFSQKDRAKAFAIYGFTVVGAPIIGPMLGGFLTDSFSWHWVFLINIPFGALSMLLTGLFVVDSDQVKKDRKALLAKGLSIDYFGLLLVALGFGTLQIVLDRYELDDGLSSPFIVILLSIACAALLTLVVWELVTEHPVVDLRLLAIRPFAINCAIMFMFGFIMYSTTQQLPQLSQELLGYDATTAGLTLGAGGIITIMLMPISGIITGKFIEPKYLIMMAMIGTGIAMYHASGLDTQISFGDLARTRALQVMWLPFLFIPLSAIGYVGVPPDKNNEASALTNLMRNIGGSVGVSITTTLLSQRNQFHFERLGEHITPYDGFTGAKLQAIVHAFEDQARIEAYLDIFLILSIVAFTFSVLTLFLPKMPQGGTVGH
jgi:DHA2 family multidrug resistance protein